jgi:hypothetical protein
MGAKEFKWGIGGMPSEVEGKTQKGKGRENSED